MSGKIILSEKHGINPHMTFCSQCGKDANELIITGKAHLHKCSCGQKHIGYPKEGQCQGCKKFGSLTDEGEIPPERKLPSLEPCDACKKLNKQCAEEVKKGGVPWRCKDCGSGGVIKAHTDIAKEWRKKNGGEVVGLEVGKEQCSICGKKDEPKP